MPRILLVKISSLGDIVHNLPANSDIRAALPEAEFDWVVEEAFAECRRCIPGCAG
jgi:heptosyltransferase-1